MVPMELAYAMLAWLCVPTGILVAWHDYLEGLRYYNVFWAAVGKPYEQPRAIPQ